MVIFASLFLEHVSNDWIHLHSVFVTLVAIALIISTFMPESPKFLVSRNDFINGANAYNFIARMNGKVEIDRNKIRFISEKKRDKRELKKQFKKLQANMKGNTFQNNIKASLAAP